MQKVVVAFDTEATEDQQKALDQFVKSMESLGASVESIGGGIRNPA